MNDGGLLDDQCREILFRAARALYKTKGKRIQAETSAGKVIVETQLKTAMLGSILGIKFCAKIEHDSKTHNIDYIVSPKDFPRLRPGEMLVGSWVPQDVFGKPELN